MASEVVIEEGSRESSHRWVNWCKCISNEESIKIACNDESGILEILRNFYGLAQKNVQNIHLTIKSLDPNLFNPLSKAIGNPWLTAHKDSDLLEDIWKDITRTFPERDFFQDERIRKSMQKVLFVWCKEEKKHYRQGMNEFIGLIYHVIHSDRQNDADNVLDMEAIAYWIFYHLLAISEVHAMFYPHSGTSSNVIGNEESFVLVRCDRIFSQLLLEVNPHLYHHLNDVALVSPSLFLLRWTKLLFAREFHIEEVVFIWDALFAEFALTKSMSVLVDFVAIAMIEYLEKDLLVCDNSGCLRRLLKFPPVADINGIIAVALRHKREASASSPSLRQSMISDRVIAARPVERRYQSHNTSWSETVSGVIDDLSKISTCQAIAVSIDKLKSVLQEMRSSGK